MNKETYFSLEFIEYLMQQYSADNIKVKEVKTIPVDNSASILVSLTSGMSEAFIGHYGFAVTYEKSGIMNTRNMVMKVKPNGLEIVNMINSLSQACGGKVAEVYANYKSLTGFQHSHMRELEVYSRCHSDLMPQIFGIHEDQENDVYIILMEYLEDVELLNSVMQPELWSDEHIKEALDEIAVWHTKFYGKSTQLNPEYWNDKPSKEYMIKLAPVWEALLDNVSQKHPSLYSEKRIKTLQGIISNIPQYWQELELMKKTLVHNDMNPRNVCFKKRNNNVKLCLYDWELATFHIPQYDVVELLSFVLDENDYGKRLEYMEYYREKLEDLVGEKADKNKFYRGFQLAAYDFGVHRLGMYMLAHTVVPYPFLPRVVNSYFDTLDQLDVFLVEESLFV